MNTLEAINELEDYAENSWGGLNESFEIAIDALKKQIPIKPIYSDYQDNGYDENTLIPYKATCPTCGYEFEFGTWNDEENHHCICGQKMDWV